MGGRAGDGSVGESACFPAWQPSSVPRIQRWRESWQVLLPPTLEKYIKIEENHYRRALGNELTFALCSLVTVSFLCSPDELSLFPGSSSPAVWTLGVPWGSILCTRSSCCVTHFWHLQSYLSLPSCGKDKELDDVTQSVSQNKHSGKQHSILLKLTYLMTRKTVLYPGL